MAQNTSPIFGLSGDVSNNGTTGMNQLVTAAANDYTGANANNSLIFTAGANGAFIERIRLKAGGTNVASVMRFYWNNGSTATSAANNELFEEVGLPATTATATNATITLLIPINRPINASFRIYMGLGTAVSAGWVAFVEAMQY